MDTEQLGRPPHISVIVPAYRAQKTVRRCLESLRRQKGGVPFEVLVVDSSDDGTAAIVSREFPEIRLLRLPQRAYPGAARNRGIEAARGEILAFMNANCEAPEDWILTLAGIFENSPLQAVAGSLVAAEGTRLAGRVQYWLEFSEFSPRRSAGWTRFPPTNNCALRRQALEGYRFPEDLRAGEDWLLGRALLAAKRRVYFKPGLRMLYHGRTDWPSCLSHLGELGYGSGVVRRRYPLPGSFLARWPVLVPGLWAYRAATLFGRLARSQPGQLPLTLACAPLILLGLGVWTWGFYRGARGAGAA